MESNFWVIPKITSACQFMHANSWHPNLCMPIHDIISYSTSTCPFGSGKCGKEEKELQKFEDLENEKSFLDEMKNIFIVFKGLSFCEKIKVW